MGMGTRPGTVKGQGQTIDNGQKDKQIFLGKYSFTCCLKYPWDSLKLMTHIFEGDGDGNGDRERDGDGTETG